MRVAYVYSEHGGTGEGGGGDLSAPTESFTLAEAAAHLNRIDASWVQGPDGMPILGSPTTVTYAFRSTEPAMGDAFSRFNANQIAAANLALQSWSDVANITFTRVTGEGPGGAYSNNASILFSNQDAEPGAAWGAYAQPPYTANRSAGSNQGDVHVNSDIAANLNPQLFEYGLGTLTHELGHAIGFHHPGDYDAGQGPISYNNSAEFIEDTKQYTIMSYWSETNTGADFNDADPSAPQIIDIAAAQRLYGANLSFNTGDTTYGFNANAGRPWYVATADQTPIFSAWDAGGEDTFDFSGYAVKQTIDLRNGFFSSVGGYKFNVSVSGAVKVDGETVNTIENAVGGSAVDTIIGNKADNALDGRNGNDTLQAGKGDDLLLGGDGNDLLVASKGLDTLNGGLGQDLMTGQKHNDRFVFQSLGDSMVGAEDRIYGGLTRLDVIDLSGIDADTTTGGNQAFHLGGASFDGDAGELIRFYHAGSNTTFIQGDVDGDNDADFSIAVTGDFSSHPSFVL